MFLLGRLNLRAIQRRFNTHAIEIEKAGLWRGRSSPYYSTSGQIIHSAPAGVWNNLADASVQYFVLMLEPVLDEKKRRAYEKDLTVQFFRR